MSNRKIIIILAALVGFFIAAGWAGVSQIYHQDEHRWVMIADPANGVDSPHPPMLKFLLRAGADIFGFERLRLVPLIFGLLNLLLIFWAARLWSKSNQIALWAAGLFAVSSYSLIAALQVDIDGAILPFFVLLAVICYFKFTEEVQLVYKLLWLGLLCLVVINGLLTKLSFALLIGVLAADYFSHLWFNQRQRLGTALKKWLKLILPVLAVSIGFFYLYTTKLAVVADYAEGFKIFNFHQRAYFDLAFKVMKSLVWLSPLLTLPVLAALFNRQFLKKYRFWFLYLLANLLFYLVLLDFSKLTVERYFMFSIAPAAIIAGAWLGKRFAGFQLSKNRVIFTLSAATIIVVSRLILQLPAAVLPLNPKAAYVQHIKALDFGFLIPFSGGSGPIGFYLSAWFIILTWLAALVALAAILAGRGRKAIWLILFLLLGLGYNLIVTGEYLFGRLYGSPAKIARAGVDYITNEPIIKQVITYNDIGAYELKTAGKYTSRFYTAPARDYTKKLKEFRGHYLIIDFPVIDKRSAYWNLISKCDLTKKFTDKYVDSYIFDCRSLPPDWSGQN
ncbi:MAG: hypothetical protein AAB585_01360 [Patescibacteria group bacterium]